jgi:class 3 adenylate cyclase
MILSSAIAALMPENAMAPLGRYRLKDIDEPQQVYGLRGVSA